MAWLWGDSFDHYTDPLLKYPHAWGVTPLSTSGGRFGTGSLPVAPGGGGLRKPVTPGPAATGGQVCIVQFWMKQGDYLVGQTPAESWVCSICPDMGLYTHVAFTIAPNGAVSAWAGFTGSQNVINYSGGIRVGSSAPGVIVTGTWHRVEVKVFMDGADGSIAVRVDGHPIITLAEQVTVNVDAGNPAWSVVGIGGDGANPFINFDMLVICDGVGPANNDFPGIERAHVLRPTTDGATVQWTPSSGTNASCVDDLASDGDSTNVKAGALGLTDLYQHAPLIEVDAIRCLQLVTIAKDGGTDPSIGLPLAHMMRTGTGTLHTAPEVFPLSTFGYVANASLWPVSPQTNAAWTVANVNGMQFGQKVAAVEEDT